MHNFWKNTWNDFGNASLPKCKASTVAMKSKLFCASSYEKSSSNVCFWPSTISFSQRNWLEQTKTRILTTLQRTELTSYLQSSSKTQHVIPNDGVEQPSCATACCWGWCMIHWGRTHSILFHARRCNLIFPCGSFQLEWDSFSKIWLKTKSDS